MSNNVRVSIQTLSNDPFGTHAMLRETAPAALMPEIGCWLVTRWDDVREVLANDERFSPDTGGERADFFGGDKCLVFAGGAQHRRMRKILQASLYDPVIEDKLPHLVAQTVNEVIDSFGTRREADLYSEFCLPFSLRVLASIFGIEDVSDNQLKAWLTGLWAAADFTNEGDPTMQALAAETEQDLQAELKPRLRQLKLAQRDVLFSRMQTISVDGDLLSEEEAYANAKQLLLALAEPGELIGVIMWLLLTHSEQLPQRIDRRALLTAIEEANRYWPISGAAVRKVVSDIELGGHHFESNARIVYDVRSANRDERKWTSPEQFDARRHEGGNLAYGAGAHMCLGARLVRRMTPRVVELLFERLPGLELNTDRSPKFGGWPQFKPETLWVRWGQ